ncbi:hypothetical protein DdX_19876 [Ditylenchus destructor]|uniref:Uncharacterized protein n=1 Tax=Ditylenchus destructor TaxID=166010 RepID=A0AAD4MIR8_9BILA|nr:hypothetical protein DdX_19876 [Ditylenchus destructor]
MPATPASTRSAGSTRCPTGSSSIVGHCSTPGSFHPASSSAPIRVRAGLPPICSSIFIEDPTDAQARRCTHRADRRHTTAAQPGKRSYANPIDIDYRYNFEQVNEGISYRTGADPVIVRHKGAFISSRRSPTDIGDRPTSSTGPSSRRAGGRMTASSRPRLVRRRTALPHALDDGAGRDLRLRRA